VNGKRHGLEKEYLESGAMASKAKYNNGVLQRYQKYADGRFGDESLL
jgi:antitoxin component YwqK of YwqJK toxin-antitoxin module